MPVLAVKLIVFVIGANAYLFNGISATNTDSGESNNQVGIFVNSSVPVLFWPKPLSVVQKSKVSALHVPLNFNKLLLFLSKFYGVFF